MAAKKTPKKSKSTKLSVEEPKGPMHVNAAKGAGHAVEVSNRHVPAWAFDMQIRFGDSWLKPGASLLRASRVVMRQVLVDAMRRKAKIKDIQSGGAFIPFLAALELEVLFLAAFAVENALKAVIAEAMPFPPPQPPSGNLPDELKGHDLADLAARAGIAPKTNDEKQALLRGQNFTEWLGRYPTPVAHNEQQSSVQIPDLGATLAAYESLFFQCVEATARHTCHRSRNGSHASNDPGAFAAQERARYEAMIEGVDPLPAGSDPGVVGFSHFSATVTTKA